MDISEHIVVMVLLEYFHEATHVHEHKCFLEMHYNSNVKLQYLSRDPKTKFSLVIRFIPPSIYYFPFSIQHYLSQLYTYSIWQGPLHTY